MEKIKTFFFRLFLFLGLAAASYLSWIGLVLFFTVLKTGVLSLSSILFPLGLCSAGILCLFMMFFFFSYGWRLEDTARFGLHNIHLNRILISGVVLFFVSFTCNILSFPFLGQLSWMSVFLPGPGLALCVLGIAAFLLYRFMFLQLASVGGVKFVERVVAFLKDPNESRHFKLHVFHVAENVKKQEAQSLVLYSHDHAQLVNDEVSIAATDSSRDATSIEDLDNFSNVGSHSSGPSDYDADSVLGGVNGLITENPSDAYQV